MPGRMGGEDVTVRDARPDDREVLIEFNCRLALETEGKTLDRLVLGRGIDAALLDPSRLRYWMAEREARAIGQAAITREWSDWRAGWIWWFQSVFVEAESRGQGAFRALHGHIRRQALAEPDVIGLRLYVEQENAPAMATYRALGMEPGGYHVYEEMWRDRFNRPSG